MLYILNMSIARRRVAWFIALMICLGATGAMADYVMPVMPAPVSTQGAPVYWRLTSIEQTPEVRATAGYSVHYTTAGLDVDLGDGLLTESLLQEDDAAQGITLEIEKNDEIVMEHSYLWTPLPIYLEPGEAYTIDVSGIMTVGGTTTPNTLLGMYVQGEIVARISAGSYTSHATSATFTIDAEASGVYRDGSLVVSIILRDVNDMYRNRIAYTYTLEEGIKPVPTPVPGFAPVEMGADVEIPSYYNAVDGVDGLFQIATAPEEYRAYGSMSGSAPTFFPADAEGNVVMNEKPADPDKDFEDHAKGFVATEPKSASDIYAAEADGLYALITRDGEKLLRAHGYLDGEGPAYYPAGEDGAVDVEAAKAIDPQDDFDAHVKGFGASDGPEDAPYFYENVGKGLYTVTGRDGETHYRAYGRLDGAEPAFYEADTDGNIADGVTQLDPQADFDAYVKGFDAAQAKAAEVPDFYTADENGVYAVEDNDGNVHYRVFGVKDGLEPAFYPSDEAGNIDENAEPIDLHEDFLENIAGFELQEASDVPDFYEATEVEGVWSFADRNDETQYRSYGKLNRGGVANFYPSDENGVVTHDALPVEPASDRALLPTPPFTPMVPETFPSFYLPVEATSLYSFKDFDGNTVYRVYGAYGEGAPQFYPADAEGNPIENAPPIDPEEDYQTYFGTFEAQEAEEVPSHYTPVEGKAGLYSYTNQRNEKTYRVYGQAETGEAGFFPADAEGRIISGQRIDPQEDLADRGIALSNAVITQAPPEATNTPLVRESVAATAEPEPTAFTSEVTPTGEPDEGNPQVTAEIAASQSAEPTATEEVASDEVTLPPVASTTESAEPEVTGEPEKDAETEGGGKAWTWIIIAGVAVLVIGGTIYFVSRKKKKQ